MFHVFGGHAPTHGNIGLCGAHQYTVHDDFISGLHRSLKEFMLCGNDFLHDVILSFEGDGFAGGEVREGDDDVVGRMYFEYPVFHENRLYQGLMC